MLTDNDIKEQLKLYPEIDILELLEITSIELVNRFPDKIEAKLDYFLEDLEDFIKEVE